MSWICKLWALLVLVVDLFQGEEALIGCGVLWCVCVCGPFLLQPNQTTNVNFFIRSMSFLCFNSFPLLYIFSFQKKNCKLSVSSTSHPTEISTLTFAVILPPLISVKYMLWGFVFLGVF